MRVPSRRAVRDAASAAARRRDRHRRRPGRRERPPGAQLLRRGPRGRRGGRDGRHGRGPRRRCHVSEPLLEVRDLQVHFPTGRRTPPVRAVDGVGFEVARGETLGLVGESGCGKSTTGLAVLRLVEPTAGTVRFDGQDVRALSRRDLRRFRRRAGMVFQDPYASLDPRLTVGEAVGEALDIHDLHQGPQARRGRIGELLERVGLHPDVRDRYPHEFSGGQRQRVGIARALAVEPDFLVLDEPIAALDVSIQAQVMNLLDELQRDLGLAYLLIAHDLAAVQHLSDRIAVMELGRVVEIGPGAAVATAPQHPYTRVLLSAIPVPDPVAERERVRVRLTGELASPQDPPSGCNFRVRCPEVVDRCKTLDPSLQPTRAPEHLAACLLHGEVGEDVPRSAHRDATDGSVDAPV
ncbi:ABC transporter ATP-binding protein [Nitriliruptoraceae bacterium ZYF776]|nr:ABC transporter ATP-binding protein [Profundirhabdus halotolerans]